MVHRTLRYQTPEQVLSIFPDGPIEDVIPPDRWDISLSRLSTRDAVPCIVLAGHNYESGAGLVGHFAMLASDKKSPRTARTSAERFECALEDLADIGDPSATEIWLGGGSPMMLLGRDIVAGDKQVAQQALDRYLARMRVAEKGLLDVEWSEPSHGINVELDCRAGILAIHNYPVGFDMREALSGLLEGLEARDS